MLKNAVLRRNELARELQRDGNDRCGAIEGPRTVSWIELRDGIGLVVGRA
jgi:hypothetical protein